LLSDSLKYNDRDPAWTAKSLDRWLTHHKVNQHPKYYHQPDSSQIYQPSIRVEYAAITKGIVYGFGSIFKVYVGNCPQPMGISAVWSSPAIDDATLIEWLNAI
jgi:hypothetical protein